MKILIIHNSQDKVRSENIVRQFASQNTKYEYEIVEAVMDFGMPQKGISKSHKKCVALAKERGWENVTIVEDDIKFLDPNSLNIYKRTLGEVTEFWDLFFGGIYSGDVTEKFGKSWGCVMNKVSGLHLYTVNSSFYDKFLSCDENYHIDYFLSEELHARSFCCVPFVAIQNDFYSYNARKITEYNIALHLKYKLLGNTT